jgi:hypothetical protein
MHRSTLFQTALLLSALQPLAVSAEDVELGFNGGTERLDNGHYGPWVETGNHTYAVCGGETLFVSAISVNKEGLFDNSVRCSSHIGRFNEFDVQSFVAPSLPNPGGPGHFSAKVHHVSDCGDNGVVLGVAQPDGELAATWGTPVLCGVAPEPLSECQIVEMPGDETDVARDAAEADAYDWTEYPAVTCGPGRYARGVAYRDYLIGNIFVAKRSWAAGGLICCSM